MNLALNDRTYDLLLLDLALPDGSGFDICKKVRQLSNLPIILSTASDEEINIVKKHGGIIMVQSELGKGAAFNLIFPKLSKL